MLGAVPSGDPRAFATCPCCPQKALSACCFSSRVTGVTNRSHPSALALAHPSRRACSHCGSSLVSRMVSCSHHGKGLSIDCSAMPETSKALDPARITVICSYQGPKHRMGTRAPQEPTAGGQSCESQQPGALHHPAEHSMAQCGALSAFLELMGWLFQPCRDPSISYQYSSGLLARAFEEGSEVESGGTGLSINPTGSG